MNNQFLLGLISGVLLMLLKELPKLAWERPHALWHVINKATGNSVYYGASMMLLGGIPLLVGKSLLNSPALSYWLLGIGGLLVAWPIGLAFLTAITQELRRTEEKETAREQARDKARLKRYEPSRPRARRRP